MKPLNLFKSIKNISYLTAFACLPLSSAYGETTPKEIIEAYAKDKTLLGAESLAGNVLAYKNINGNTIVLKSGNDFVSRNKKEEKDVRVVSLEEVLKYTGDNIYNFGNSAIKGNDDWHKHIKSEFPFKRDNVACVKETKIGSSTQQLKLIKTGGEQVLLNFSFNGRDNTSYTYDKDEQKVSLEPLNYIDTFISEERFESNGKQKYKPNDLQSRLDKFRHTEIQIQALWNKYNDLKTDNSTTPEDNKEKNKKKNKKNFDPWDLRGELGKKQQGTRELIKTLLPRVLLETMDENNPNQKIYSLFEACDACEKTNWLKNKKDIFMFAILDGQFTKNGKYKVKDKEAKKPEEEKVVFMSQKNLEDKKIKDASDLEEDFTKL